MRGDARLRSDSLAPHSPRLPPELRDELIALRLRSPHSHDEHPIFASRNGTPLGHRNVTRRGFEPAAKEAKLEGVSMHSLRHAAASRLIRGGLDPVTVAHVLGHENATVTLKIYAHLFNRERLTLDVQARMPAVSAVKQ